jgi:fluoroacetyl-CoA thioesterase
VSCRKSAKKITCWAEIGLICNSRISYHALAKTRLCSPEADMLTHGTSAEASFITADRDMASALPIEEGDEFPEVLATSRMVALMELAAARAMRPVLQAGELSVGVMVNVRHLAATPNHTRVSAIATYLGAEAKLYRFRIEAFDPGGKIGEGEHTRAIVKAERLIQGAQSRVNKNEV